MILMCFRSRAEQLKPRHPLDDDLIRRVLDELCQMSNDDDDNDTDAAAADDDDVRFKLKLT